MPSRHRRDQLPQRDPGFAWAVLMRQYPEEQPCPAEQWQPQPETLPTLARIRDGLSRL